jgi:hypothetical protein
LPVYTYSLLNGASITHKEKREPCISQALKKGEVTIDNESYQLIFFKSSNLILATLISRYFVFRYQVYLLYTLIFSWCGSDAMPIKKRGMFQLLCWQSCTETERSLRTFKQTAQRG